MRDDIAWNAGSELEFDGLANFVAVSVLGAPGWHFPNLVQISLPMKN